MGGLNYPPLKIALVRKDQTSLVLDQNRSRVQELLELTNRDLRYRGHKASLIILKDKILNLIHLPSGNGTNARTQDLANRLLLKKLIYALIKCNI